MVRGLRPRGECSDIDRNAVIKATQVEQVTSISPPKLFSVVEVDRAGIIRHDIPGWPGKKIDETEQIMTGEELLLKPLYDAEEVARILGIARKTVHKLVRLGKLGCIKVTEKDRRFTREQVQAYIDSVSVEPRIDKKSAKPVGSTPPKGGGENCRAKSFEAQVEGSLVKELKTLCR